MTTKLLMIALDGADSNLVDRWSLDGTLPNISRLRARGSAHHLQAPHGVTDDSLWASFQYGVSMGEHGRFNYYQRLSSGKLGMAFLDEADREHFWDRISASGKRVAILDVPKVPEPRPLNGIHLADWLVHGRYWRRPRSYPTDLADEVVEMFGAAPPSNCGYIVSLDVDARREALADIARSVELKRRAGLHYLGREDWDLFVIGFKETHCVGHGFWDMEDASHPHYRPTLAAELGAPIRTIFQAVDAAVGELIALAGPEAQVILFSTTKMEPNASLQHFHNRLGRRLSRRLAESTVSQWIRRARRQVDPVEIMPYGENGTAIRINREGATARAKLTAKVEATMRTLEDADTGEPLVERIYHPITEEPGQRSHQLPDLLVRYRAGHVPRAIRAPALGTLEAAPPNYRPGNHACGPFVIGAGVDTSAVNRLEDIGPLTERLMAA